MTGTGSEKSRGTGRRTPRWGVIEVCEESGRRAADPSRRSRARLMSGDDYLKLAPYDLTLVEATDHGLAGPRRVRRTVLAVAVALLGRAAGAADRARREAVAPGMARVEAGAGGLMSVAWYPGGDPWPRGGLRAIQQAVPDHVFTPADAPTSARSAVWCSPRRRTDGRPGRRRHRPQEGERRATG